MCIHKKFYYKVIFWTSVTSLIVMIILCSIAIYHTLRLKSYYDRYEDIFHEGNHSTWRVLLVVISFFMLGFSTLALLGVFTDYFPILLIASYGQCIFSLLSILFGFMLMGYSREVVHDWGMMAGITKQLHDIAYRPDFLALNNTVLDPLQIDFECCGVFGFIDYQKSSTRQWMSDLLPLPKSCCWNIRENCLPNTDEHKKRGCMKVFTIYTVEIMNNASVYLVVFGIAVGINGLYTCLLSKKAKEMYLYYPYYI